ncbi:MAG: LysM peptidoglycan-binding domain-containing protein [Cyanobium sp.]
MALLGGVLAPWSGAYAQGSPAPRTVKVSKGDTLEGIAQRHGVSAAELKRINGLKDADLLQIGQTLRLPTPARKGMVVVKSGDTLESIAKANNTTAAALQKANPGIQPNKLKVGGTLRLPSSAAVPAAPVAPAAPPVKAAVAPAPAPTAAAAPAVQLPPPGITQERQEKSRWRYYGDTVVDWGGWKRLPDGVRFTLVQPAAKDVGEARAQATAIAVDCSTLRHNWRVKDAWEPWTVPAPRSVGQQIVLDLCGNAVGDERRQVPAPPSPKP